VEEERPPPAAHAAVQLAEGDHGRRGDGVVDALALRVRQEVLLGDAVVDRERDAEERRARPFEEEEEEGEEPRRAGGFLGRAARFDGDPANEERPAFASRGVGASRLSWERDLGGVRSGPHDDAARHGQGGASSNVTARPFAEALPVAPVQRAVPSRVHVARGAPMPQTPRAGTSAPSTVPSKMSLLQTCTPPRTPSGRVRRRGPSSCRGAASARAPRRRRR
jgi:hypothetical protein